MNATRKNHQSPTKKRLAYLAIGLAIIAVGWAIPAPEGLSFAGKMALTFMIAGIFLWITEPIPMAISGLVLMVSLPAFGILPYLNVTDAATGTTTIGVWGNFISNVIFFILASFGFTAALLKTKIPAKTVLALLKLTKGNARATVGAFMLTAAALSLFISDLPCTALLTGIAASSILETQKCSRGESNLGKALMIGITYASVVGGQAIPSGSAMNVMAMNMLSTHTGMSVSFLGWTAICLPLALILLVACWASIVLVFKPERIEATTLQHIEIESNRTGRFEALDWKVIGIVSLAFVLWIASNWTGWDITAIAVISVALFFLPGIDVLTWREYTASVSWSIVVLIGCVQAIAGGIKEQGAAQWLFGSTMGSMTLSGSFAVTASAALLPLLRLVCPVGPAFIAICLIPLAAMAPAIGVSPVVFAVIVGVNASTTFLMGLDSNNMLSYRHGYWNMIDFFKAGIAPTITMVVLHATLLVPLTTCAGY